MYFPVSEPDLSDVELKYVEDAVRSTWISSSGKYLDRFESEFSELINVKTTLAVSNGTVALHLILLALGLGEGDEVIVPSFTYIASVNAIRYVGATPVFVDVSEVTWGIDAVLVENAITSRTKAVIGVHLYGQPFDVDPILEVTKRHNIFLIEDAAEAPLSTYKGKPVGSFGIAASFSFYGNKVITCGEGGAVTTSDESLASKMKLIRSQGMDPERRYYFPVIGHNFRLTNVAAAILCGQLQRLGSISEKRQVVCDTYDSEILKFDGLHTQPKPTWSTWTPWLASATLARKNSKVRSSFLSLLLDKGVDTRPFFMPVHEMPPYRNTETRSLDLPVTNELSNIGFNLPTSSKMTPADVKNIMHVVKLAFNDCAGVIN